jgi:hypothetical protein
MLLYIVVLEVEMNNYPYQMKMQTSFYKYQYTNRVLCAELEKCLFVEHIMNLQYWEHGVQTFLYQNISIIISSSSTVHYGPQPPSEYSSTTLYSWQLTTTS